MNKNKVIKNEWTRFLKLLSQGLARAEKFEAAESIISLMNPQKMHTRSDLIKNILYRIRWSANGKKSQSNADKLYKQLVLAWAKVQNQYKIDPLANKKTDNILLKMSDKRLKQVASIH